MRGGIVRIEHHEAQHLARAHRAVAARERKQRAGDVERREPLLVLQRGVLRQQRHAVGHVENARGVLRPLDVAGHPVEVEASDSISRDDAGRWTSRTVRPDPRHLHCSSTTHVSFVPPPCEEFTTSEPSRSATRVRPPGTIIDVLARQHEGTQVDVRGRDALLDESRAGGQRQRRLRDELARARRGCAARSARARRASRSGRSACRSRRSPAPPSPPARRGARARTRGRRASAAARWARWR